MTKETALNRIFQLPHISRPMIAPGRAMVSGMKTTHVRRLPSILLQKMVGEHRNVFPPLGQRWQRDPDHVQAVLLVIAELAVFHPEQPGLGWSRQ